MPNNISNLAKLLNLALFASSVFGGMSYAYSAQAKQAPAKQVKQAKQAPAKQAKQAQANKPEIITKEKVQTVAEYRIAPATNRKASALNGTVKPNEPNDLVADAPDAQQSRNYSGATNANGDGFYASVSPGVFFGRTVTFSSVTLSTPTVFPVLGLVPSGTYPLPNDSIPIPNKTDLNSGFGISGAVGYKYGDIRTEAEVVYSRQNFSNSSAGLSTFAVFANGYYDVFGEDGFKPYVGLGVGVASNSVNGSTDVFGIAGGSTGFAYQLKAGLPYVVNDKLDLGLGLRLLGLSKSTFDINANGSKVGTIEMDGGVNFVAEFTARLRF